MTTQRQRVPTGSATAKAIDYSLKRWAALTHYLGDGDIPIDTTVWRIESGRWPSVAPTGSSPAACAPVLERTVRELLGVSCLALDEVTANKQQIISSRSFGRYITRLPELEEAVAAYISLAAEKLRAQNSIAGVLQVYVRTNPFSEHQRQYQQALSILLPRATADTGSGPALCATSRWPSGIFSVSIEKG